MAWFVICAPAGAVDPFIFAGKAALTDSPIKLSGFVIPAEQ